MRMLGRFLGVTLLSCLTVSPLWATCGGGGGGGTGGMMPGGAMNPEGYFVPWKVLAAGEEPARGALIVNWIPASRDDMRKSDLLTSRQLTMYSSQCVGMQLV